MILTSRRQHRALITMHSALRTSDPTLVAKFLIFSRLTCDEAMPTVETVRRKPLGPMVCALRDATRRRRLTHPHRPRVAQHWRLREILFLPIFAAAVAAVAVLLNTGQSAAMCTPAQIAAHSSVSSASAGQRVVWPELPNSRCLYS